MTTSRRSPTSGHGSAPSVASSTTRAGPSGPAVSRSIGDVDCQPAISPVPDVRLCDRVACDIAVIVACDGGWDVLTTREVSELVLMHAALPAHRIAAIIRDTAFARNSFDNITCIVCKFL